MKPRPARRIFQVTSIVFVSLLIQSLSQASDFCSRTKADLLQAFEQPENRLGFKNDGGLGNGGVCWWHSRLQRSSIYLATYAPEKAKPSDEQATSIVRSLTFFTQVVEIPGYSHFSDFSKDYEAIVQKELNRWQIRDGFINQQWIRGLSGKWSVPASELQARMDTIYDDFLNSPAGLWVMVQLKGITSHALLIIGMTKLSNGYDLNVIDSNYPDITRELHYLTGEESIRLGDQADSESFTPYPGFQDDLIKINQALRSYCQ